MTRGGCGYRVDLQTLDSSPMSTFVSREAVAAAVSALLTWMRSRSKTRNPQLLLDEEDDLLYLVISLKRIPSSSRTNPFLLPLPHSLFSTSSSATSVFLIADDRPSSSPSPSAALDLARSFNLPVSEVVGISDLRSDYRPFESRRKLCGSHDLIAADRRVIPLLPRLLGKSFFRKKKIPLPLDLSRPGWPQQLQRCLNSTFLYLRSGTCSGIKVGRLSMEIDQIVDNFMAVVDEAVARVPKKWGNVRSLHIKAMDSVALPIYQAVPQVGLKIDVPQKGDLDAGEKRVEREKKKRKKEKKKAKMDQVMRYVDGGGLISGEDSEDDGEKDEEEGKENTRKRAKKNVPDSGDGKDEKRSKKKKKKKKKKSLNDADEGSDGEDHTTGGVGDVVDEEENAMNKKKGEVRNSKKRKEGQGKGGALLRCTGEDMKNKSKTKKLGDKQVQKTKV